MEELEPCTRGIDERAEPGRPRHHLCLIGLVLSAGCVASLLWRPPFSPASGADSRLLPGPAGTRLLPHDSYARLVQLDEEVAGESKVFNHGSEPLAILSEWVVTSYVVNVVQAKNMASQVIGRKCQGEIILGHQEGPWLMLTHEPGWVMIELNGQKQLQRRVSHFISLANSTCSNGTFPVVDMYVCRAAAIAFGHASGPVHLCTLDDAHPRGCYTAAGSVWFAVSPAMGSNSMIFRGMCAPKASAHQLICSTNHYVEQSTGFMDKFAIAKRLGSINNSVARSLGSFDTSGSCQVMWAKRIGDFVGFGLGAAMELFQPLRAYLAYAGCNIIVSESLAFEWKAYGLEPFWNSVLSDSHWKGKSDVLPVCSISFLKGWTLGTDVKCKASADVLSDKHMQAFWQSPSYNKAPFHTDMDLLLQTFGRRLMEYSPPFTERYAGFHVRLGDKTEAFGQNFALSTRLQAINVPSLAAILRARWPDLTKVFFASDDAVEIITATNMNTAGSLMINWTKYEQRWIGGTPPSQVRNRPHTQQAISAALDDMLGLAGAAVLIGGSHSSFFNVARRLNLHLHLKSQRPHPWCYDAFAHQPCN